MIVACINYLILCKLVFDGVEVDFRQLGSLLFLILYFFLWFLIYEPVSIDYKTSKISCQAIYALGKIKDPIGQAPILLLFTSLSCFMYWILYKFEFGLVGPGIELSQFGHLIFGLLYLFFWMVYYSIASDDLRGN